MSDGLSQRNELLPEHPADAAQPSGRDWAGIGVGLAAAFALVATFLAGMWAVVVLVEASA